MNEIWFSAYCRYGSEIGADRESREILNALIQTKKNIKAFGISDENDTQLRCEFVTPVLGRLRASVNDRFSNLYKYGARVKNEAMIDNILTKKIRHPVTLISSCLSPRAFQKNKDLGGTNIFYAKNGFDFHEVVVEQSRKWDMPTKYGEERYLKKYLEMVGLTNYFCVLSRTDTDWLKSRGVSKDHISMVTMGVGLQDFRHSYTKNLKKINEDKNPQDIIWGCMGGSILRKGIPLVLSAWKKSSNPKGKLLLIGISKKEQIILTKRFNLKNDCRIKFIEYCDKYLFFETIDYFISPSLAEGQPRASLESLSAGITLIASERGSAEIPSKYLTMLKGQYEDELIDLFESPPPIRADKIKEANNYVKTHRQFDGFGFEIAKILKSLSVI